VCLLLQGVSKAHSMPVVVVVMWVMMLLVVMHCGQWHCDRWHYYSITVNSTGRSFFFLQ